MNPQAGGQSQQSNPFIQAMEQMRNKSGGSQPQTPPSGNPLGGQNAQVQANMPPGMPGAGQGGGAKAPIIENSTTPGQNPGSTDSLIKALGALNSVITDADDPQEVQMVRQIITMIQELIKRDQVKQGQKDSALSQSMNQAGQGIPPQIQAQLPTGGAPQGSNFSGQPGMQR